MAGGRARDRAQHRPHGRRLCHRSPLCQTDKCLKRTTTQAP